MSKLLFLLFILSSSSFADTTYIYKGKDGTLWFGDKGATTRIGDVVNLGIYGRAPAVAVANCHNEKQKSRNYIAHIKKAAQKYKVDYYLIKAVIKTESCFDHKAVSRVGAQGLMQLMPKTASYLGVKKVFNPKDNIMGGTKYLKKLLGQFNQNTKWALAAYNAGPTAVIKYNGIPPYKETKRYVKKVMSAYEQYAQ
jgi:soluble lytic murein transglycosylase-like protein